MGFCVICLQNIEDTTVTYCIDCGGAICEECSYNAVHCFDCGGILCNSCDGIGLCQNCEVVAILEEDLFDEEML